MNRTFTALPVALLLVGLLGACGSSGSDNADATTTTTAPTTTTTTSLVGEVDADEALSELRGYQLTGPVEASVVLEDQGDRDELTFTYINKDKYSLWNAEIRIAFDRDQDFFLSCKADSNKCSMYNFDSTDPEVELARASTALFTSIGTATLDESSLYVPDTDADDDSKDTREVRRVGNFDDAVCYASFERELKESEICIDPQTGLTVLLTSSSGLRYTVESVSDRLSGTEVGFTPPAGAEVTDLRR